ncbi:hypothetical protein [Myxococcus xanthus]|uniref:Uncharacterized protein n=1 Tax=Myxococcus xanthus TaxID=34 RepID=A0A7Y4IEL1_MYXXA|nr:hypothetical protein [Myxococcus xanthus]NOJ77230.1 hypothetical protein [Myxococcus xanthus]NOJ85469.1 hypothetical protein [Myxococcus xanthus]
MESTTRSKPRILFAGATTGQDFNSLKDVGELSVSNGKDGLEAAEVCWIDCLTTKPGQYEPLLRTALDEGKTLVLSHPDAHAHQHLSKLAGCRVDGESGALMVSRDLGASTPSSYVVTALAMPIDDPAAQQHSGSGGEAGEATNGKPSPVPLQARTPSSTPQDNGARHDWAALLESHGRRAGRALGGPGLIPPAGVMYGIRTLNQSYTRHLTNSDDWSAASGKSQTAEFDFVSSFYVYRENGKPSADYVVIRIQEATFNPSTFMVNVDNAKGFWQYHFETRCTNNRNVPLLSTSPGTTNGPGVGAQISLPVLVKSVQDGSCVPNHWSATHGPVGRSIEGWALLNQSSNGSGTGRWVYHHRDFWNSQNDPPDEFGRWWAMMYEGGYGGRVKTLTSLARAAFTVENICAWRFSASTISSNPNVTFTESLNYRHVAFANPKGTGRNHRIVWAWADRSASTTINLVTVTDIASPCR